MREIGIDFSDDTYIFRDLYKYAGADCIFLRRIIWDAAAVSHDIQFPSNNDGDG